MDLLTALRTALGRFCELPGSITKIYCRDFKKANHRFIGGGTDQWLKAWNNIRHMIITIHIDLQAVIVTRTYLTVVVFLL